MWRARLGADFVRGGVGCDVHYSRAEQRALGKFWSQSRGAVASCINTQWDNALGVVVYAWW